MHKSLKSINTVIFEGIELLKAHVVSFFSYLTSVPRTFDLDCSIKLQFLLLCFHTFLTEVVGRSC